MQATLEKLKQAAPVKKRRMRIENFFKSATTKAK